MKRALVVGLNDYPINALHCCAGDAVAVGERLARHGNGDINFDVAAIYGDCTRDALRAAIVKCFEATADTSLFYFAGHGNIDAYGGQINTTDNTSNDLSLREILEIVNRSQCTNKIVILDSCFSGAMGNQSGSSEIAIINSGVTILTACTHRQVAIEQGEHGIFTSLLLAALDGEAADLMGNVTLGGIYAFIDKSLGAWEQRPVFKTNVTNFAPLRKVTPPIDTQILRNLATYFSAMDSSYALNPSYEETNTPEDIHAVIEPYAIIENVSIMKELQKLVSVGLVRPCDAEHMYSAAMGAKSCQLTAIGKHYWRLATENRI
jgi:hypothetical protein